jgi:TPR repeat protein
MRRASLKLVPLLMAFASGGALAEGPRWIEVKSPNFVVISDAKESEARRVAFQFEQIRALFAQQWPWARLGSGRPFVILAARNENSLKQLLPEFWESKDRARPDGIFLGGADRSYAVLRVDAREAIEDGEYYRNPYHVIHHEYVHLLLNLNFEQVPTWLNEGLAEYWGDTIVEGGQVSKGLPIPGHLWLLQNRTLLPTQTLLEVEPGSPFYNENDKASVFYAQSWALVHYLFFGVQGEGKGALNRLAAALKKGVAPREATAETLPAPAVMGKALEAYIHNRSFTYHRVPAPLLPETMKAYISRPLTDASSRAILGGFFAHSGRTVEARALLEEALRLDPNLAEAHEAAGLLAMRERKLDQARTSFTRAVELDPDDFLNQFMKGHFLLGGSASDGGALAEAEAALLKSTQLNHDFAPSYAALAMVASQRGATIDQTEPLARRAISLEPGNATGHLSLAMVLASAGKMAPAREAGARALAVARSDEERAQLQAGLESLLAIGSQWHSLASGTTAPANSASYEKGCEAGEATACTDLALAYEGGEGVPKDQARAVTLHGKACDGGASASCDRLGSIYEFGWGVASDPVKASTYFERACADDEAMGCQSLGFLRESGRGGKKDGAAAVAAYDRACRIAQEADACSRLAQLLVNGQVPKDPPRAAALAEEACTARPRLCGVLGLLYETGTGVSRDPVRARQLHQKACAAGNEASCPKAGQALR